MGGMGFGFGGDGNGASISGRHKGRHERGSGGQGREHPPQNMFGFKSSSSDLKPNINLNNDYIREIHNGTCPEVSNQIWAD